MPPGTPFLERLASALVADISLGGRFAGAPELAEATILLPTRRAVRALGDAFLRAGGGAAMVLPAIRALGDVDEEELVLDPAGLGAEALDLRVLGGELRRVCLFDLSDARRPAWRNYGASTAPANSNVPGMPPSHYNTTTGETFGKAGALAIAELLCASPPVQGGPPSESFTSAVRGLTPAMVTAKREEWLGLVRAAMRLPEADDPADRPLELELWRYLPRSPQISPDLPRSP